jgi:hypothetical protein
VSIAEELLSLTGAVVVMRESLPIRRGHAQPPAGE